MTAKMKLPNGDTLLVLEVARNVQKIHIHLDVSTLQEEHTCGSIAIQTPTTPTQAIVDLVDYVKTQVNTRSINHIQYNVKNSINLLSGKVNLNFNYIKFQVKWNSIDGTKFETEDLDQAIYFQSIPISFKFVFSFSNAFILLNT